ncbi:DUF6448 family protein [Methanobacterium alcaliphilum]|uniref:DUF6448 family protein n=1 Tax=Methanobacterium alcaliphilum TaxID=392018 RepID=UPI00200BA0A6|nr:DUF6448 family protein [Methanobacterium alcaliphilum]MCK9151569.1 DUF6448 family protein [Methanobacterium alcaliphilum]
METHCNAMDGPVVNAAELALEMENVNYILPFVKKEDEKELKDAFEKVLSIRELSEYAADVADFWFFETSVRLHFKGEGFCYDGLKPAKNNKGSVINRAEKVLEDGELIGLVEYIAAALETQLKSRFDDALNKKDYELNDIGEAREYIKAKLEFVFYANEIHDYILNKK